MPGAAECKRCGETIWWFVSKNGRTYPPLTKLGGTVVVVIDDVAHTAPPYQRHVCKKEDIEAYDLAMAEKAEKAAEQAALTEEQRAIRAAYREHREEIAVARELYATTVARLSMEHDCNKCGVPVGDPCENLMERRRGNVIFTANPHAERVAAIPREHFPYWIDPWTVVIPEREEQQ